MDTQAEPRVDHSQCRGLTPYPEGAPELCTWVLPWGIGQGMHLHCTIGRNHPGHHVAHGATQYGTYGDTQTVTWPPGHLSEYEVLPEGQEP